MVTTAFTGHRGKELGSYNAEDLKPLLWKLSEVIEEHVVNKKADTFISGMALGVDLWAARIVLKLKEKYPQIKLVAAIPCRNQSGQWPKNSQQEWQDVYDKADEIVLVTDEDYKPYLMEVRNRYMVDNSDYVIAVYNGNEKGGTANCVKYARKKNKEITVINPKEFA